MHLSFRSDSISLDLWFLDLVAGSAGIHITLPTRRTVQVEDRNRGAISSEAAGDRFTDPGRATGDESDLPRQARTCRRYHPH